MNISHWSDLPLVLTTDQVASVLQLRRRTIANLLDRGDLRGVKIGKEWRISRAELERFVEGNATRGAGRTAPSVETDPSLIDKGGILVAQTEPLEDLAVFVQRQHDQRLAELIQQVGL